MEKKFEKIVIHLKDRVDGINDRVVIRAELWDDYEVVGGLFVVKKDGAWIAIFNMTSVICITVQ